MPSPTRGDVHVNRPLTNLSIAFLQNALHFVAAQVFPNIPVRSRSDQYFTYSRGEFNRDEMKERAPATESAGGGYNVATDSYSAKVWAFHKDVDDQIRNNADAPINLDREATEFVTLKALIRREVLWVSKFFTTTLWTTDITGVDAAPATGEVLQWDDDASTPIEDVAEGKATILESTGMDPNTMTVGYRVWQALKDHPDIIDRIKFSGGVGPNNPAIITQQAVAALFEVDRLLIMKSIQNTAEENLADVHSFIGGKNALLSYSAPSPGILTPSAGYTFSWNGHLGAGAEGNRIKRFRMEELSADRVEIEMAFDQKLVSADLGFFWATIVP